MKFTILVQNLKCGGCANSIKKGIEKLQGVSIVEVDVATSEITVEHSNAIDSKIVEEQLCHLGYPKENANNNLRTKAKSFVSCGIGRLSNA